MAPSVFVLCIGCNYPGQASELGGCVNDAKLMSLTARNRLGKQIKYNVVMTDDLPETHNYFPSRRNIEQQLGQIVTLAKQNKITGVVVHYSGHGSTVRDRNGDELDHQDETILPNDFQKSGMIIDDWFQAEFLARLPASVRVFGLFDSCHSGTFADQKFVYTPAGRRNLRKIKNNARVRGGLRPHLIVSGCTDNSYSYDQVDNEFGASGACTVAFVRAIRQTKNIGQIIRHMRLQLGKRQVPQLSASYVLNSNSNILVI